MSRKKDNDRDAPPLLPGEHYSRLDSSNPFFDIVCVDHWRYLSTDEAVKRHLAMGCKIKNFRRDLWM